MAKANLESVNDSLQLQLDDLKEKLSEAEEEGQRVKGDLEEMQSALTTAEEEIRLYQQDLSETQVCIYTCMFIVQAPLYNSVNVILMYLHVRTYMYIKHA